jgi:hypothetical protein
MDWVKLVQDRVQWRVLVNTVMNLRFHWGGGGEMQFIDQQADIFSRTNMLHGASCLYWHHENNSNGLTPSTSNSSCWDSPSAHFPIFPSRRLAILLPGLLVVIFHTSNKRCGLTGMGRKRMEGNTKVSRGVSLGSHQPHHPWDFFLWRQFC